MKGGNNNEEKESQIGKGNETGVKTEVRRVKTISKSQKKKNGRTKKERMREGEQRTRNSSRKNKQRSVKGENGTEAGTGDKKGSRKKEWTGKTASSELEKARGKSWD